MNHKAFSFISPLALANGKAFAKQPVVSSLFNFRLHLLCWISVPESTPHQSFLIMAILLNVMERTIKK